MTAFVREQQRDTDCLLSRNKNARRLWKCLCPSGRNAQRPGLGGEEQVSRKDGGERWEAEESAALSAPV